MVVLAVETATRAGSLAILVDDVCHAREGRSERTHAERLPLEAVSFLAEHGLTLGDVDLFSVIAGPGSFTGLRVGVAAVQGLALTAGRLVVSVPTLEALADGWMPPAPHETTAVFACLDGQRDEVFFAAWVGKGRTVSGQAVLVPPQVGRTDEFQRALGTVPAGLPVVLIGPAGSRIALAHDPAREPMRPGVHWIDMPVPLAAVAAQTAARQPDRAVRPHALKPIYIRRPDAEVARERARANSSVNPLNPLELAISRLSPTDDLSDVEALQRRSFSAAWGEEAIRWELTNTNVARLYVLRDPAGELLAYCSCWMLLDELHINSLAVDEPWRRRGLAQRLLARVFTEAVAAGARSATLEVRQSNQAARALYEGLGFVVEATRRGYYQSPREDALILWHRRLAEQQLTTNN
jgi:tRNA threonylcarbamoyl adenosine modification protein YeaZ/ribosomal-protein-alanine acetyltransferase